MFGTFIREATAAFDLVVCSPLLIGGTKSGSIDPTKSDDRTLESYDAGRERAVPVIPGSSIKGVFRSAVEWEQDMKNVTNTIKDCISVQELFGKTEDKKRNIKGNQKSKISFNDAFARDGYTIAIRNSTAIEPLVQSTVNGALFNTDTVTGGSFEAGFRIINFKDEELLSILRVMDNINEGSVRFGGRTSRGFGKMKIGSFSITITEGYDDNLCPIEKTFTSIEAVGEYISKGGEK